MSAFLGEQQAASDAGRWAKRQEGGPVRPPRDIPMPRETVVSTETGGMKGAIDRMGLRPTERYPQVIEQITGRSPAEQERRYADEPRARGGKVRPRQGGGNVRPLPITPGPQAGRPTRDELREGVLRRLPRIPPYMSEEQANQAYGPYPAGPRGYAKGGKVRPGKHAHLLIIIGLKPKADRLRKRGMISDKAAAKRGL